MGNAGHRACCCSCLRDLCRTDLQSNEEAAQQKNAGSRRGGSICRCNSGSPSDCADTDAALKIFNPSAAWPTTRRSLPAQSVAGEYIGCQKKLMLSSGESMSFSVCRYGQPLVWSAFYLRFHYSPDTYYPTKSDAFSVGKASISTPISAIRSSTVFLLSPGDKSLSTFS